MRPGSFARTASGQIKAIPTLASLIESPAVAESPLVKRMLWSGLMAATGALATLVATRVSAMIWRRVFDEEPPE